MDFPFELSANLYGGGFDLCVDVRAFENADDSTRFDISAEAALESDVRALELPVEARLGG